MARECGIIARNDRGGMDRREKGRVGLGEFHCKIIQVVIGLEVDMIA
jgi:hypothetical protein